MRQFQQPWTPGGSDRAFHDLGVRLDEEARVLRMHVVGDMERHARMVANMGDPGRALAADDEEAPRLQVELVPHGRDVGPAVAGDGGDARIPRRRQKRDQLILGEAADLVARLEAHGDLVSARGSKASRSPSPTTLKASTASMMNPPFYFNAPATTERNSLPSFRMVP